MSIISVNLLYGDKSSNDNGNLTYTQEYLVISNIPNENVYQVEHATGIPAIGDEYICNGLTDYGSLCQKITPTQDKNVPTTWNVVCEFKPAPASNDGGGGGGSKPSTPPAGREDRGKRLPDIKIDKIEREVIRPFDINGTAIMSSTKEPLLMPHKILNYVVTISYWDWWNNLSTWSPYNNTINSATFWGTPAHSWRCSISSVGEYQQYENGSYWIWWHKTLTFEQKYYLLKGTTYQTWDERPVDMGTLVLDPKYTDETNFPDLTKLVHAKDLHGNIKRSKVFLDGFGREIGTPHSQEDPSGLPVLLGPYQVLKEMSFSTLVATLPISIDLSSGNYA